MEVFVAVVGVLGDKQRDGCEDLETVLCCEVQKLLSGWCEGAAVG